MVTPVHGHPLSSRLSFAMVAGLFLALVAPLGAGEIVVPLAPAPGVERDAEGFARFTGEELQLSGRSGEPALPARLVRVLLPADADPATVTVHLEDARFEELEGEWAVRPVPPVMRWDGKGYQPTWPSGRRIVDGRDTERYASSEAFPAEPLGPARTGRMRRWQLAEVAVAGFQYRPGPQTLLQLVGGRLAFRFEQRQGPDPLSADRRARQDLIGADVIERLVANFASSSATYSAPATRALAVPGVVPSVAPGPAPTPADAKDGYAIITTTRVREASLALEAFAAAKRGRGFNVWILTEESWGGGAGDEAAENIRAWLQDHYLTLHIKYVLLIGDPRTWSGHFVGNGAFDGDVPMKMLWSTNTEHPDLDFSDEFLVPSDHYYADLTGDWDLDGDGYFGEMILWDPLGTWGRDVADWGDFEPGFGAGGVDIYGDVVVGRIPCYEFDSDPEAIAKLDHILAKTTRYEEESPADAAWRKGALLPMTASNIHTPGWHLGEQIKDDVLVPQGFRHHRVYEHHFFLNPVPETIPRNWSQWPRAWTRAWRSAPFGAVFWWAHGSPYGLYGWRPRVGDEITGHEDWRGMQYTAWTAAEVDRLRDRYPSFTFQASCCNSVPEVTGNLSYRLLQNGAVGTIGGSRFTNFWSGIGPWDGDLSSAGMAHRYARRLIAGGMPAGDALADLRLNAIVYSDWWQNRTAFNLYGDPSIGLRSTSNLTAGYHRLRARVFADQSCDGAFTDGVDWPLERILVTLTLDDGTARSVPTDSNGRVRIDGFDAEPGVAVRATVPDHYGGYAVEMCPGSLRTVALTADRDFNQDNLARARFRARLTPLAAEGLSVEFGTAVVNGRPLDADDPVVEVEPGERLSGYLEVVVENRQPGSYITPVIGASSWGRQLTGADQGWLEDLSRWAPTGRSVHRLAFDLAAPDREGEHHLGIFAGWMYAPAEVAAGDHPPVFGDGDDVWDLTPGEWAEVVTSGQASGSYRMPGRAVRVMVSDPAAVSPDEWLEVEVRRAVVNGQTLSREHPNIVIEPQALFTGFLEVEVDNEQFANDNYYITPVIGTASWRRGWVETISARAEEGRTIQTFRFALEAPEAPGTYYVGLFSGWMYNAAEVAANDHPPVFLDGDDVWDMPTIGWHEVMDQGQAASGPYHMPGRAIQIVVADTKKPYIRSIDFFPEYLELGEQTRGRVKIVNPLPYGTRGSLYLDVDRNRLAPYDHSFDRKRVWLKKGESVRWFPIRPGHFGRYDRQAWLSHETPRGSGHYKFADQSPWGFAFRVGADPYVKSIIAARPRLKLGEQQKVTVVLANPDGRRRKIKVELAVARRPMGLPVTGWIGKEVEVRGTRASVVFVDPGMPYEVGFYDVAARLAGYGGQKGPMFGFEVVAGPEPPPPPVMAPPEDKVHPSVEVAVDAPNGGETWNTGATQTALWTRKDLGDSLSIGLTIQNPAEEEAAVLVSLYVAKGPGGPSVFRDSWLGRVAPRGNRALSFRYTPPIPWTGDGLKEEEYFYQVSMLHAGKIVDSPWVGPRTLRRPGAVVEKTSVHILYGGVPHSTWEHKAPNTGLYVPEPWRETGVSHRHILASDYLSTNHARVRVELFDANDTLVATDESDADCYIWGGIHTE